jgi:hypothetical protein
MDEEIEGTNEEETAELPESTPEEQSKDKDNPANHAFAEVTRENRKLKAKQDAWNQKVAGWAKQAGLEDIQDIDGYLSAVERQRQQQHQQQLATQYQNNHDPALLAQMAANQIKQDPEYASSVAASKQMVQYIAEQQVMSSIQSEIAELNETFGTSVKNINEVNELPNGGKIVQLLMNNQNMTLSDAYLLANKTDVLKNATAKQKQQLVNQAHGFDHIGKNATGGDVDNIQVTDTDIQDWKKWFPDKSRDQCIKEIRQAKKNGDL